MALSSMVLLISRILNNLILFIIKAFGSAFELSKHHRFQASMLKLTSHLFMIEELNLPCSILQNCAKILLIQHLQARLTR